MILFTHLLVYLCVVFVTWQLEVLHFGAKFYVESRQTVIPLPITIYQITLCDHQFFISVLKLHRSLHNNRISGLRFFYYIYFFVLVVAVECDPIRIAMATHNAEIYGVGHLIEFVCDDYFTWSQSPKKTEYMAAFMSPPWGGPSYLDLDSFELSNIKFQNSDTDFWSALYLALVLANGNAAVYLPRNTNIANFVKISTKCVKELRTDPLNIEFELDLINSKAKALTVYFGALANCNQLTVVPSESSDSSESDYSE
ncbi:unnamed protein product [Trichobilharzia regenti]|nr:unnamed protein product [Trichobilharzia regenti]